MVIAIFRCKEGPSGRLVCLARRARRAALLVLCLSFGAGAAAQNAAAQPDAAPLFAATLWNLDDQSYALAALRGKPLIVNFWARWCGPCRVEIPELVSAQRRLKPQGVVIVGIGVEDKAETVREFAHAYDMDYPVLLGKGQALDLLRALGNSKAGLPYTLVIDRDGKVLESKLGPMTREDIDRAARLLR